MQQGIVVQWLASFAAHYWNVAACSRDVRTLFWVGVRSYFRGATSWQSTRVCQAFQGCRVSFLLVLLFLFLYTTARVARLRGRSEGESEHARGGDNRKANPKKKLWSFSFP